MDKQLVDTLEKVWGAFRKRITDPLTLATSLTLARSVVAFEVARSDMYPLGRVLTGEIWARAAAAIISSYDAEPPDTRAALRHVCEELHGLRIDAAVCIMLDGVEALESGDLVAAAAAGREGWARDGHAHALSAWLEADQNVALALGEAVAIADLLAWALAEITECRLRSRQQMEQLRTEVNAAIDATLFRDICAKHLSAGGAHAVGLGSISW